MHDYQQDRIKQMDGWLKRAGEVPYLKFPPSWTIAVIPPFTGADARFFVRKGRAHVSVYLDFDGRLGAMDEPYWEVYPVNGDCHRSLLNETDDLLAAIAKSIRQQNRRKATHGRDDETHS